MPSSYAHYRFGCQTAAFLPDKVQLCVVQQRHLYEIGLHGPDFLFFRNPLFLDRLYKLGLLVHRIPGKVFFENAAASIVKDPTPGQISYLFGVLNHFVLDSICHPYVNQIAQSKKAGHIELETEFDRKLMLLDGVKKPYHQKLTGHICLKNKQDPYDIALFYPGASPADIRTCFRLFCLVGNLCALPFTPLRKLLTSGKCGATAKEMVMHIEDNPNCTPYIPELLALYQQALGLFPKLSENLYAHLTNHVPLQEEFDLIFG